MHTFTLAFISCLSLSVHAASIGDSVSQVVTGDHQSVQHNREFGHHPDFGSATAHSESFEPAGKISQRHGTDHIDSDPAVLGGTSAIHTRQLHKDASLAKPDALDSIPAPQLDSLEFGRNAVLAAATPKAADYSKAAADSNGAGPVNVYDPSKVAGFIASDIPITVAGVNVIQDIANNDKVALGNFVGNSVNTKLVGGNIDTLSGNTLNIGAPKYEEKEAKKDEKMRRQASTGLVDEVVSQLPSPREDADDQVEDVDGSENSERF